MTELRKRMIKDVQLAGRSKGTQDAYIRVVRQLAGNFRVSPDQLTERQVRGYLMHLREFRKVAKSVAASALTQGGCHCSASSALAR